jgi:hypothetical protein
MIRRISHDRREESIEAKTRWFLALPLEDRMEMLCSFTDLALAVNPDLLKGKNAQQTSGRIQVLTGA